MGRRNTRRRSVARIREGLSLLFDSPNWVEVPAVDDVREQAVRQHRLRVADALQVAAAIVAADFQATSLPVVTLDIRQREAAEREGFPIP